MVLQCFYQGCIARKAGLEHAKGPDDHAAFDVGLADHAALGHAWVAEQCIFYLGRADVVAGCDDHVVVARLVEKVALFVLHKGVAGVVPAVLDIVELADIVQVLAAGRALDRKAPDRAMRYLPTLLIHHLGEVPRHNLADGAWANLVR